LNNLQFHIDIVNIDRAACYQISSHITNGKPSDYLVILNGFYIPHIGHIHGDNILQGKTKSNDVLLFAERCGVKCVSAAGICI